MLLQPVIGLGEKAKLLLEQQPVPNVPPTTTSTAGFADYNKHKSLRECSGLENEDHFHLFLKKRKID